MLYNGSIKQFWKVYEIAFMKIDVISIKNY